MTTSRADFDIVVVGGGAAGLATAIFALQAEPRQRLAVLDGARHPGAKILVSGGSRCNVTNAVVTAGDFNGGRPSLIRNILRTLPVPETIQFFQRLGIALHEEPHGKLFPDTNRARDVLQALLRELERLGGTLQVEARVLDVSRPAGRFVVTTARGAITADAVVLATGGLALPKSGSDGAGYDFARRFGHTIIPTTPALTPLVLGETGAPIDTDLSGVSLDSRLLLRVNGRATLRIDGAMLWTHFGVSGPAVLDASRHWLRAHLDGRAAQLTASLEPAHTFEGLEARWVELTRHQPRIGLRTALALMLPDSIGGALLRRLALPPDRTLASLTREDRRKLTHGMLEWPLAVSGSRGYAYAEATAGGVELAEVNPGTMQSRLCDGLYLVGELLDVDGRLGGFNFQWAWSSAHVAGQALARRYQRSPGSVSE